jgi:hypothetical protein
MKKTHKKTRKVVKKKNKIEIPSNPKVYDQLIYEVSTLYILIA